MKPRHQETHYYSTCNQTDIDSTNYKTTTHKGFRQHPSTSNHTRKFTMMKISEDNYHNIPVKTALVTEDKQQPDDNHTDSSQNLNRVNTPKKKKQTTKLSSPPQQKQLNSEETKPPETVAPQTTETANHQMTNQKFNLDIRQLSATLQLD